MANNIGIKVDVAFPSANELQEALEKAWAKVKSEVDVNIKLGVNKTALTALKTSIKNALNEDLYEIDISTKNAREELSKVHNIIREIDKELKQERKLKVNLDVVNLKSSLKDLLGSMENVQRESKNMLSQGMQGFNDQIKNADKNLSNLTKKFKLNKNGELTSITTGQTKKDSLGASERVTFKEDSKGMTADVEYLHNKETALKAVQKEMKHLYDIEKKMQVARQNGDQGSYNRYKAEHDSQAKNVVSVKEDYQERYGESANASEMIKALQEKHKLERDIIGLKKKQADAVKAEKDAQEKINKEMKDYKNTVDKAFSEYLKYSKDIASTNEKLKTATGEHKEELEKQLVAQIKKREEIDKEHDLMNVISSAQREQIKNVNEKLEQESRVKSAQEAERERVKAISQHMSEYEKTISRAFGEYTESLKESNALQEKLENATGEYRKELERQLVVQAEKRQLLNSEHNLLQNISDEQAKSLKSLREKLQHSSRLKTLQAEEAVRIKAISDNMSEYEKTIKRAFDSYKESLRESSRLQKELENATGLYREELEKQLTLQNSKQRKLIEEHSLMEQISDAQKEEVDSLKEKLRQSERLQEARDVEKEINKEITAEQKKQKDILDGAFDSYMKANKELNSLYGEMQRATGKHKEALQERYSVLTKERDALDSQHDLISKISDEQRERLKNATRELHYAEKIKSARHAEAESIAELKSATTKLAQLEQKRHDIQKQLINATGGLKDSLRELDNYYAKIIDKIKDSVDFEEKATYEQKQQLQTLRDIQNLQIQVLEAKKKEAEYTEQEKGALMRAKSIKQEILSIEEKIASLEGEGTRGKDGVEAKLQSLKHALMLAKEEQNALMEHYSAEKKITDAIQEQNKMLEQASDIRMRQILNDNEIQSNQEKANSLLKDYQNTLKTIGSLQRDLVFAGDREKSIIEQAIDAEKQKLATMKDEISASKHISDERKNELDMIERAQAEQLRLNNLRQDAREVDRVYSNAYGVTDIQSYASNASQAFREILEGTARIDEAFMRVKKVAEATDEDLQNFKDTSYDVASGLGVAADDYMMAVEKWVTAGYTLEQSKEYGQISTIGSFVGNIDTDLMAKWMSVPLNTYKDDLLSANDIVNVMNETSNNHAIEMEELGKAYMRGANSAKTAGVSFSELTGMITGAQEATRIGGERIGTSMKTISANFLQLKSPTTAQQQKKTDLFKAHGIDITKAESLTDVLAEVNGIWGGLEDTEQNALVLALAGKEHSNVLTAIINEWETVKEASSDSDFQLGLELNGSAYKEFNEQKDSVRFALAELENAWLELMNTIGESDGLVKNVLDALTKGLNKLSDLASNEGLMEFLKILLIGVGFSAGTNGLLRAIDLMGTGVNNMKKDMKDFVDLLKGNPVPYSNDRNSRNGRNGGNGDRDIDIDIDDDDDRNNRNNRNSRNSRNNRNGNNRNDNDDNDNNRNDNDDIEIREEVSTPSPSRMSTFMGGLKTVTSMIPYVGNALLVAELLGADVFGKAGEVLTSITSSTNDFAKKSTEAMEDLEMSNLLTNGDMDVLRNESSIGEYSWKSKAEQAVQSGEGFSEEEFAQIKEDYNNRVKELGLQEYSEFELEITWNDSVDVLKKIEDYNKALDELAKKEALDLAKGYMEGVSETAKVEKENDKEVDEKQAKVNEINKSLEKAKANLEQAEKDGDKDAIKAYTRQVENLTERYDEFNGRLEKSKETQEELDTYFENLGESLSKLGEADLKNVLEGVKDSDEMARIVDELGKAHERAQEKVEKFSVAQGIASKGTQITREEFKILKDVLGESTTAFENTSYEDYIDENSGVQESIEGVVTELQGQALEAQTTAEKAYISGQEMADGLAVAKDGADKGKEGVDDLKESIDKLPNEKNVYIKYIEENVKKGYNWVVDKFSGGKKQEFVSTAPTTKGVVSANVSTTNSQAQQEPVISNATATTTATEKSQSEIDAENATVNEDIWRYWKTEDKQQRLETIMSDLTRAIEDANGDSKKLASIYKQQLDNIDSQKANLTTLKTDKSAEAQAKLRELQGYGFNVDTNSLTISNLGHAQSLKGDKATEAEALLNEWKSLTDEIEGFDESIKDLNETVKDVKISIEMNNYAPLLKRIEKSLKVVDNRSSLNESYLGLIDAKDSELNLQVLSKSAYDASDSMNRMINFFGELSVTQTENIETAEELHSQMATLKDGILENADAMIEFNVAINDLEFSRATSDINGYKSAVESLQDNLENTRDNVAEGLLSGTKIGDLQSTINPALNLSRVNKLDVMAQQRLTLEKDLQVALDGFAEKNIERELTLANSKLAINKDMYNQLLKFESDYNNGKHITQYAEIFAQFNKSTEDVNYNLDKGMTKLYEDLSKMQKALDKKYAKGLSSKNYEERLEAEYQYGMESLKIENEINKNRIQAVKLSIEEYNRQLEDKSLSQTQKDTIVQSIQAESQSLVELQNSVKSNIEALYSFQLGQVDKLLSKYDDMVVALEYSLSLIQAISPNDLNAQYAVIESMKDNEILRKQSLRESIATIKQEMSLLEKGSYEWNILNSKASEYNSLLLDVNKSILEMNSQIQSNQLSNIVSKFEKTLFEGKTSAQFQQYQDLWLTGLERELALEEMYQKIADLGTDNFNEKMALLEKQDKISRLEADYLMKQMEIYELQKGLEEGKEQRGVKTLQQNADGTFQWNYVADDSVVDEQSNNIKRAQIELLQMENDAKNSYLTELQSVVDNIQSNGYSSKVELEADLSQIGDAYSLILGDIPASMNKLSAEIIYAYEQAKLGNEDLLNELSQNGKETPVVTRITSLEESMVSEIKTLGDRLETAIRDSLLKSNNYSDGVFKTSDVVVPVEKSESSNSFIIDKLEFPNAISADEIKQALINLPQYALQKIKSKR